MSRSNPRPAFVLKATDQPHLARIPERLTVPLCLIHAAGNSYKSIAEDLNIPIGTVKSRINRARERVLTFRAQAAATAASQDQLESADD